MILDSDSEILEFWSFNEKNNGEILCIFSIFSIFCLFYIFYIF